MADQAHIELSPLHDGLASAVRYTIKEEMRNGLSRRLTPSRRSNLTSARMKGGKNDRFARAKRIPHEAIWHSKVRSWSQKEICTKTLRLDDYRKDYRLREFPRYLKSVLIGLLLSDGSLERSSVTSYPRLNVIMSVKNYSYILHLFNLFEPYVNSHIKIIDINKNNELNDFKVYSTGRFKTVSLPQLVKYYNLFYKEDKVLDKWINIVPSELKYDFDSIYFSTFNYGWW